MHGLVELKLKCETEYLNRVNICKVREDILKVRKTYSVKIIKVVRHSREGFPHGFCFDQVEL